MKGLCNQVASISLYLCHVKIQPVIIKKEIVKYLPVIATGILFILGILLDFLVKPAFFTGTTRLVWYIAAYLPVVLPAFRHAVSAISQKNFFNEFTLMIVATLGAFFIGEYPEGVAVMLFYTVGDLFQESAVRKARRNIKTLLGVRPDTATVIQEGVSSTVSPEEISIGEIIQAKAGEKIPLDGTLLSPKGSFNTSALTGESVPRTIHKGETVLAGMVNLNHVIEVRVESICRQFLVPCAGDGAGSHLPQGEDGAFHTLVCPGLHPHCLRPRTGNHDDPIIHCFGLHFYRLALPGTGVSGYLLPVRPRHLLPTGLFWQNRCCVPKRHSVQRSQLHRHYRQGKDNHPVAKAILEHFPEIIPGDHRVEKVEEIAGHGMSGLVDGHTVLTGNAKLMRMHGVKYDPGVDDISESVVLVAIDRQYAEYLVITSYFHRSTYFLKLSSIDCHPCFWSSTGF